MWFFFHFGSFFLKLQDVSTSHLEALVTWCFLSRELLRKPEIGGSWYPCSRFIDGALFLMYVASFTFLLVHCGSLVSTFVLSSETECPVALQWSPTPVGMVRLVCSLKRFPSGRLVSPMYTCAGSWSHVISYMTPHFLSFGVLSFGCTRMERRVFTGLWYTLTPCCLNVFDSLSDKPCTYGRSNHISITL